VIPNDDFLILYELNENNANFVPYFTNESNAAFALVFEHKSLRTTTYISALLFIFALKV